MQIEMARATDEWLEEFKIRIYARYGASSQQIDKLIKENNRLKLMIWDELDLRPDAIRQFGDTIDLVFSDGFTADDSRNLINAEIVVDGRVFSFYYLDTEADLASDYGHQYIARTIIFSYRAL